jgi:hypothetical protein
MRMTQVLLVSGSERGRYELVCWIDAELAKKGQRVQINQDEGDDVSDRVWVVEQCYGSRESTDLAREYRQWRQFWEKLEPHGG